MQDRYKLDNEGDPDLEDSIGFESKHSRQIPPQPTSSIDIELPKPLAEKRSMPSQQSFGGITIKRKTDDKIGQNGGIMGLFNLGKKK